MLTRLSLAAPPVDVSGRWSVRHSLPTAERSSADATPLHARQQDERPGPTSWAKGLTAKGAMHVIRIHLIAGISHLRPQGGGCVVVAGRRPRRLVGRVSGRATCAAGGSCRDGRAVPLGFQQGNVALLGKGRGERRR